MGKKVSLQHLVFLLLTAIIAGVVGGFFSNNFAVANIQNTVRAQNFLLLDDSGKVVGQWGTNKKYGTTFLKIMDKAGKQRVGMGTSNRGTSIILFDNNKKLRIAMSILQDVPQICVYGQKISQRIVIELGKDGPYIKLFDDK